MIETTLMMQANKLFGALKDLWWNSAYLGDRGAKVFRLMERSEARYRRRMKNFVRRINERRNDEILGEEFIE